MARVLLAMAASCCWAISISGMSVTNITDAKDYLSTFGYLDDANPDPRMSSLIQSNPKEAQKLALLQFQGMANINLTGELDAATMEMMNMTRCGVKDMTRKMPISRRRRRRYALQGSRWGKRSLTYNINNYTPDLPVNTVRSDIARAFDAWAEVTPLEFRSTSGTVDIDILFAARDHGDGIPFDGPGTTLAHAYYPQFGGDAHFDEDETFTANSVSGINLLQVAVHEFGHSLGLAHSDIPDAVMAPFYRGYQSDFQLHPDDIMGIQALYGGPPTTTPTTPATPSITPTTPAKPSTTTTGPATPSTTTTRPATPSTTTTRPAIPSTTTTRPATPSTTKTTSASSTTTTTPSMVGICDDPRFQAAAIYRRSSWNTAAYAFRDDQVIRLTGAGAPRVEPILGSVFNADGNGPNGHIDAAMYWPYRYDIQYGRRVVAPARTYLFKGHRFWRYDETGLLPGYPANISVGFPGIPDNLDGALRLSENGKIYFFKGDKYWRYVSKQGVDRGYPRLISQAWSNIPSNIDSGFVLSYGYTYFMKANDIYRRNSYGQVRKFSLSDALGCSGRLGSLSEMGMDMNEFDDVGGETSEHDERKTTTGMVVETTSTDGQNKLTPALATTLIIITVAKSMLP